MTYDKTKVNVLTAASEMVFTLNCIMLVETTLTPKLDSLLYWQYCYLQVTTDNNNEHSCN